MNVNKSNINVYIYINTFFWTFFHSKILFLKAILLPNYSKFYNIVAQNVRVNIL